MWHVYNEAGRYGWLLRIRLRANRTFYGKLRLLRIHRNCKRRHCHHAVGYGAGFLGTTFTPIQTCLYTIALLWIAAALNFSGSRYSGKLSAITIWGAIIPVLGISIIGWHWFSPATWLASWNPNDLGLGDAVGNSIALTLWSFLGLESAAVNMDAVENPKNPFPLRPRSAPSASLSSTSLRRMSSPESFPMPKFWHRALPSAWPFPTCSAIPPAK